MHKLTEDIFIEGFRKGHTQESMDAIIIEFLKGAAERMLNKSDYITIPKSAVYQALGLNEKEEGRVAEECQHNYVKTEGYVYDWVEPRQYWYECTKCKRGKHMVPTQGKVEKVWCQCRQTKPRAVIEVVFENDNYADSKHSVVVKCAKCFTVLPRPKVKGLVERVAEAIEVLSDTREWREWTWDERVRAYADAAIKAVRDYDKGE